MVVSLGEPNESCLAEPLNILKAREWGNSARAPAMASLTRQIQREMRALAEGRATDANRKARVSLI